MDPKTKTRIKRWLIVVVICLIGVPFGFTVYQRWLPRFTAMGVGDVRRDVSSVSMIRLLGSPDEFAGKGVRVTGFLKIEFEGDSIYLHEEDCRRSIYKNGLWVDAPPEIMEVMKKMSGHYVMIEGTFDLSRGHMSLWSGTIKDINRAALLW